MRSPRSSGFTLIEGLLAAVLFLLIVVGIIPLFTRATVNTVAGRESTDVSNLARSRAEELIELPFNSVPLTVTAGSSAVVVDYLVDGDEVWTESPEAGSRVAWTRTTTIRQYGVGAFQDGVLSDDDALPAGTGPESIHLKEVEVLLQSGRAATVLGPPKEVTVRVLKSK